MHKRLRIRSIDYDRDTVLLSSDHFYSGLAVASDMYMDPGKALRLEAELVLLLMYANLLFVLRYTFFPRGLIDGHVQPLVFDAATAFPFRLNLVPLVNLFEYNSMRDLIWNVVGNAIMFLPTGIILPIVYKKLNNFWKVLAAGAGISLCIEILQLPFSVRASDVDDLILNTLGVIIGYGIYALVRKITAK